MHTADLHLGSELMTVPERSKERKQELLATFRRITQICAEESVDILLIAGDLFEGANTDPAVVALVKAYLGQARAKVFISPGNHDYIALDSPYLEQGWPQNVTIFKGAPERKDLDELNVSVFGAGFESTYVSGSLLPGPDQADPSRINLCVVHGDLVSSGGQSVYHPITAQQIAGSRMDYLALGHIHQRKGPERADGTVYAYPGCPEGRGFDETGEKGALIGTVRKGGAELSFRPLSVRCYFKAALDVSQVSGELEAERLILAHLEQTYGERYREHFYRLSLTGRLPQDLFLSWAAVEVALAQNLHYVALLDETALAVDYEVLANQTSIKGIFVRRMLEKIKAEKDEKEQKKLALALEYGIRGFEGEVRLHGH